MIEKLGAYRVEKKLADGGMGSVYLATSPTGRRVVCKVPHAQSKEATLALADEARTGKRLTHPSIVETLDFFVDKGTSVLVVAFIDGVSLFELRARIGPLQASGVVEVGRHLASALAAIHSAVDEHGQLLRILHRDVSPANVIVDVDGHPRLIDLGIARTVDRLQKQTQLGMVKGTLRYLAPEVVAGGDHSQASDLWALGVTLWETAVGHYIVPGDELRTARAVIDGTVYRLLQSAPIDQSLIEILQALVAPIDRRLKNARAAQRVLERAAERIPGGADLIARAVRSGGPPAAASDPTEVLPRAMFESKTAPTAVFARASPTTAPFDAPFEAKTLMMPTPVDLGPSPAPDIDTADTIQMGAWEAPAAMASSQPPADSGPKKSLFIPMVVVGDDDEDHEL